MTEEAKRVKIAEACGWKLKQEDDGEFSLIDPKCVKQCADWEPGTTLESFSYRLPDYFHDLNAMHEAEKTLTDEQWLEYAIRLAGEQLGEGWPTCFLNLDAVRIAASATAAQRAEAFGRVKGLWE